MSRTSFVSCVVLLAVAVLLVDPLPADRGAAAAQRCECDRPADPDFQAGVLWSGTGPALGVRDIVTLGAPVLWFSSDEPLVIMDELPAPHVHPCDAPADTGVVYYQIRRIRLRPDAEEVTMPGEDDPEFFEKVEDFTVRFYFYYRQDYGMNPHVHDLEVCEIEIALDKTEEGCYQVRMVRAYAFAHGTDWYSNELVIEKDTKFPLTLFVEEGKHATCPDRNADGVYTPGYDVNVRINDAWGVRDVFGAGYLISASYKGSMTKARQLQYKVLPPKSPYLCTSKEYYSLAAWDLFVVELLRVTDWERPRYELRAANTVEICEDDIPHKDFLVDMMTRHRFGKGYEPEQYRANTLKALAEPLKGTTGYFPSVNLRYDRRLGLSFALRGREVFITYVVPRFTWIPKREEVSVEAMLSESASRFIGSYVSIGAGYELERVRAANGDLVDGPDHEWTFVTELGVKFRFRPPGKLKWFLLGNDFGGIRFGARISGFDYLSSARFIAEIGTGVW